MTQASSVRASACPPCRYLPATLSNKLNFVVLRGVAHDLERLGGALRQSAVATRAARSAGAARSTVQVYEDRAGPLEIRYRERVLRWTEIAAVSRGPSAGGFAAPTPPRNERGRAPARITLAAHRGRVPPRTAAGERSARPVGDATVTRESKLPSRPRKARDRLSLKNSTTVFHELPHSVSAKGHF